MTALVNKDDFATYGIVLAVNLEDAELTKYILQAQDFDVRPQLGDIFYYNLLLNPTQQNYIDLLNGVATAYTYQSHEYLFEFGLKAAICFFAQARYLPNAGVKNTEMGFMKKKNEFSEHTDSKAIQVLVNNSNSAAIGYLNGAIEYLDRYRTIDSTKYPLWKSGTGPGLFGADCSSNKRNGFRMSKVGNI